MCDWLVEHADYEFVDFGTKKRLEITGTNSCVMLSDIRKLKSISREARQRLAGKDGSIGVIAVGIVMNSKIQAVMFNFFNMIYKAPSPVKLFTDKEEAIKWCKQFVPNDIQKK
jgi:hypothetical protein